MGDAHRDCAGAVVLAVAPFLFDTCFSFPPLRHTGTASREASAPLRPRGPPANHWAHLRDQLQGVSPEGLGVGGEQRIRSRGEGGSPCYVTGFGPAMLGFGQSVPPRPCDASEPEVCGLERSRPCFSPNPDLSETSGQVSGDLSPQTPILPPRLRLHDGALKTRPKPSVSAVAWGGPRPCARARPSSCQEPTPPELQRPATPPTRSAPEALVAAWERKTKAGAAGSQRASAENPLRLPVRGWKEPALARLWGGGVVVRAMWHEMAFRHRARPE